MRIKKVLLFDVVYRVLTVIEAKAGTFLVCEAPSGFVVVINAKEVGLFRYSKTTQKKARRLNEAWAKTRSKYYKSMESQRLRESDF